MRQFVLQPLRYALYVLLHVLLVSRLVLFERGWCFFYLGFLLFLLLGMVA